MDIKQIAKKFILKDSGIISAICFVLSCFGWGLTMLIEPSVFRFMLILLAYVLLTVAIYCQRVAYLSKQLELPEPHDYIQGLKLFVFDICIGALCGILIILEFLLFAAFRGEWYIFHIFAGLTAIFFIVCFFSYISVAEIGFLKGDIRLRDFLKVEQFNQKYPAILLAKLTAISLVQFILAFILVIALMKTCQEWSILAVSSIGSYFISLFIFRLEDLKIYYMNNADIAQLVE